MTNTHNVDIVGRAERIDLIDLNLFGVPAKVDTGADLSAIWASKVTEKTDGLYCIFFGESSELYTGKELHFPKSAYKITRVANSFGHKEIRYKVKLRIRLQGRLIRATFTLSDRSQKTYPILLGRRLLHGKFVVDVTKGEPLLSEEKHKKKLLERDLIAQINEVKS